jgi:PQQ-dependent dehydrogenase (methanol/ethanol family)
MFALPTRWITLAALPVLMVMHAARAAAQRVDEGALLRAAPQEWLTYGRDYAETHYSPLSQINTGNVSRLAAVWTWAIPRSGARLEATPIISNGVLYATGPRSFVFALDARTGRELWHWDPEIPGRGEGGPSVCCGEVNRGVAVFGERVFVGLLDGRLVALNRVTGTLEWSVQTTPPGSDYSITGAPRIVKGNVVIGNGGAEYGVRGYVTAYDAETGRQVWRWYTVPGNPAHGFENEAMRRAADTWTGEWWRIGGGGTAWDGMAYDPALDLLYVGTGNGSPWNRDARSPGGGDNLFLSSIVALRGQTGEYVWHYQTTPGDDWDYTATQPLMLLDLTIAGRPRNVIVQAPKNGFFYVLDRVTGEFISAQPFADVITWATGIDQKTGRPIETPEARYGITGRGVWLSPGAIGAHNWRPMAFNPGTGLVYLPIMNNSSYYERAPVVYQRGQWNTGVGGSSAQRPARPAIAHPATLLKAWDPVRNAEVWRYSAPGSDGGALATGGNLVFWGIGNRLVALDAQNGAELWSAVVGTGTASPVTYELDGRQYVTILAGQSGQSPPHVWTFALQ